MKKKKEKHITKMILIMVFIAVSFLAFGEYLGESKFKVEGRLVNEGNITYKEHLINYYDIEYSNNGNGLKLEINNPCIIISSSSGNSMQPYMVGNTLAIIDTCFPFEDLEIGDIISYNPEWNALGRNRVHHRIIDIDYDKEWVKTQGDNNLKEDDLISFDRIYGKDIGYLDVLRDKKVIKKEVINESNLLLINSSVGIGDFSFREGNQTCVCSSSGFLSFCHFNKTILEKDTFILENDLKEEYCEDYLIVKNGGKE